MELFLDVLSESFVDTVKMLPFLFLAYLFIEYVEHRHGERIEAVLESSGRWGAIPAALLGCVPQCGFSAIASNFYASRVISLGTLIAVFLATSDEAVPLLVSMPAYWDKLVLLMVIKVLYAIAVGLVLDFVLRGVLPRSLRGGYTGNADEIDCHETHDDEEGHQRPIWQAALRHTLEIFAFIFLFSVLFGLIVEGVGEDVFADFLGQMGFFQPVFSALVGLIPNCAASVLLTQLYVEGALRFSSLVAGQPLVEAEPLHHRPDMGRRCRRRRRHPARCGAGWLTPENRLRTAVLKLLRAAFCGILNYITRFKGEYHAISTSGQRFRQYACAVRGTKASPGGGQGREKASGGGRQIRAQHRARLLRRP